MLHVVLYQPEIPPNTGNVIRLCANTGACLHLIEPLGFTLEDAQLRRAGLDYHDLARVTLWPDFAACLTGLDAARWFAVSTRGLRRYDTIDYHAGDVIVFGPETRGLPPKVLTACPSDRVLRLPMVPGNRSLNLSNAVAVLVYEAWKQLQFRGASLGDRN